MPTRLYMFSPVFSYVAQPAADAHVWHFHSLVGHGAVLYPVGNPAGGAAGGVWHYLHHAYGCDSGTAQSEGD